MIPSRFDTLAHGPIVPLLFDAMRELFERDGFDPAGLAALLITEADAARRSPIDSRLTQAVGFLESARAPQPRAPQPRAPV